MKTDIEWAQLHAPLFLAGTNLGDKLDPKQANRSSLKMVYDELKRHLYVTFNGKTVRVPETSVLSMGEALSARVDVVKGEAKSGYAHTVIDPPAPVTSVTITTEAQVDSPTSHVFAGLGKGQTGQGARVK